MKDGLNFGFADGHAAFLGYYGAAGGAKTFLPNNPRHRATVEN